MCRSCLCSICRLAGHSRFWLSASDYGRLLDNLLVLGSDRVGPVEGQKA